MSSSLNAPQIDAGVETSASDEDESGLDTPLPPPPSPESYSDADEMGAPPPPPPPPSFGFSGAKMAKGKGDLKKALEKSNVDSETVSKSGKMFEELGKIFLKKGITKKAEIQISSTASSDQGLSKTEYNSPEHQALLKEKMKAISGASTESLSFDAKIQGKWTKVSQKDVDSGKISQDDFNLLKTKAEERSQKDSQKFSGKGTSIQKTMTKEPLSQKALDIQKKISETKKNAPQGSFLDQIKLGSSLKKAASSENIISDSETSSGNPLVEALKSAFKTGLKKNELTKGGAATEKNTQIDFKANLKKTSIKLSDFEAKQEEINKQAAVSMKNNPDAKSKILKKTPPPPLPRDIVEITPSIEDSESPPPLPPRDNLETTTDINDVMPNELNVHSSATTITNEPIQVESSTLKMATDLEPQIEIQSEITIPTLETQSTLAGFIDEPIQVESSTLKMATDLEPQIEMQPEITIPTLETQSTLAGPIDEPIQLNNQITEENIVPPPPPPPGTQLEEQEGFVPPPPPPPPTKEMNTQPEVQKTVQKKAAPKSTMSGVLDQIGQGKFFKTQKTTEEIDAQLLLKKNELQKTGAIVKEKPQDLAGVLFSALQSKGLLNTNDTEDEDNEGWDDEPSYTPSTQSQVSTQAGEKEVQPELKPTTSKITTSELTKPETPQKKKTSKEIHEEEVAQEKTTQALKLGLASRRAAIANNDDDDD